MYADNYIDVSYLLDEKGLLWEPEVGDEVSPRGSDAEVSILVDPQGMSLDELRGAFVWLPTLEQLLQQIEMRRALLFHAGLTQDMEYEAAFKLNEVLFEGRGPTLRVAFANVLSSILEECVAYELH